jgi:hypothetical protein
MKSRRRRQMLICPSRVGVSYRGRIAQAKPAVPGAPNPRPEHDYRIPRQATFVPILRGFPRLQRAPGGPDLVVRIALTKWAIPAAQPAAGVERATGAVTGQPPGRLPNSLDVPEREAERERWRGRGGLFSGRSRYFS